MKNMSAVWMIFVGVVIVLSGVLFALVVPYYFPFVQDVFYNSFSVESVQTINITDRSHVNWIYGVLGATLCGWGSMILVLSVSLLREDNRIIWNSIVISAIAWFIIDTIITLKYKVYPNLILNIVILLFIAIPYFMKKLKHGKNKIAG